MKKNLQDIDKIFRDALDEHPEPAPPGVWDNVNNDLDKKQAIVFREKYIRVKRLAVLLALFVVSAIVYMFYSNSNASRNSIPITQSKATIAKENKVDANSNTTANTSAASNQVVKETGTTEKEIPVAKELTPSAIEAKTTAEQANDNDKTAKEKQIVQKIKTLQPVALPVKEETTGVAVSEKNNKNNDRSIKLSAAESPVAKNNFPTSLKKIAGNNRRTVNGKKIVSSGTLLQVKAKSVKDSKLVENSDVFNIETVVKSSNTKTGETSSTVISQPAFIKPITAYLYQPGLATTAEYATPGSSIPVDATLFDEKIKQQAALEKALAAAARKASQKHPFSIEPFVSTNHSFRRLETDAQPSWWTPGRDKFMAERDETQGFSYSAGVHVNYNLSKSLILQSGVVFTSSTTNISPRVIFARPDNFGHTRYEFNCAAGYAFINPKTGTTPAAGDSVQSVGSSLKLTYIGVPIALNYVWQRGRFLIKPGIGVSVNFLTSGKSMTTLHVSPFSQKEKNISINGLKSAYVDASLGLGAEYMFNRRMAISLKPLLRMGLTSINKNTPVKTYQNFLNLEAGLKINL